MRGLSKWVASHPKFIVGIWLFVVAFASSFALKLPSALSSGGFSAPSSSSAFAQTIISRDFPTLSPETVIVVINDPNNTLASGSDQTTIGLLAQKLKNQSYIASVESEATQGVKGFMGNHGHATFMIIRLSTNNDSIAQSQVPMVERLVTSTLPTGIIAFETGGPALGQALNLATQHDVTDAERIAFPLLLVVLLLVLRSVVASLLPLVVAGFTLPVAMGLSYFISRGHQLNILMTNAISMIGLGVVVDYSVFIVSRFRQEIKTESVERAAMNALGSAGRAVFYSGMAVVVSLVALFLPKLSILTSIAVGGVVVVIVAVVAAWTLLPAILVLLGTRVNSFSLSRQRLTQKTDHWYLWLVHILKHPVLYFTSGVAALMLLAVPVFGLKMQAPIAASNQLPLTSSARQGLNFLNAHFSVPTLFPIEVVVGGSGSVADFSNLQRLQRITESLAKLSDVQSITGPTSWLHQLTLGQYHDIYLNSSHLPVVEKQALARWINQRRNGWYAVINITPRSSVNASSTHSLVGQIRSRLVTLGRANAVSTWVGGQNAIGYDFDQVVITKFPEVILAVFLITILLLIFTFRSIVIPFQAVFLNALVTLASMGVLVGVFQKGFGGIVANPSPINSVTPVILFAVLFGLSMDYEVFIVSRIKERHLQGEALIDSIAKGVSDTARLVTGAAAIMIAVFLAFAATPLGVVQQLGIGLSTAIFLDALIVRSILVPTMMRLFGRANWWFPRFYRGSNATLCGETNGTSGLEHNCGSKE